MARIRGPKRPSLNAREAAEYMGITERQLRRLIEERRIAFWKTSKNAQGHVRLDPDELDRFIEEHTVEAQR